jgi:hypothetical protein
MSESDANQHMLDTARMRGLAKLSRDPLEDTQRLPVAQRRGRQHQAAQMHGTAVEEARQAAAYARVYGRKP